MSEDGPVDQRVERRRLDRVGTGALVAGTAGAAAVVLFVIMEAFGEHEGTMSARIAKSS